MTKSIVTVCDPSTSDPYPVYVLRPATNNDGYIPKWDGANAGKLKNGIPCSSGTSTGTGSYQTIAHGLGVKPNVVSVVPDAEDVLVRVWADANNVYIRVTVDATYDWAVMKI